MPRSLCILLLFVPSCADLGEPSKGDRVRLEVNRAGPESVFAHSAASAIGRDVAENAEALMQWSYMAKVWNDAAPSSNSHRLLACGAGCESSRTDELLIDAWIASATESDVHALHRGEFLASLATAEVPVDRRLPQLGGVAVESRLHVQLDVAVDDEAAPWNEREGSRGVEFGWLLQAACHYHGADFGLPTDRASRLFSKAMGASQDAATEAGTHELEGLATCLGEHAAHGPSSLDGSYALIRSFLAARMDDDLNAQEASGQLYADIDAFDTCDGELCEVLGNINRQAHFFEWAALMPAIHRDARIVAPLERLRNLTRRAVGLLPPSRGPEVWWPLLASAASHTAHVATIIESTYGDWDVRPIARKVRPL